MLSLHTSHAQDVNRILQPLSANDRAKLRTLQSNDSLSAAMQYELETMEQGKISISAISHAQIAYTLIRRGEMRTRSYVRSRAAGGQPIC
jgi:Tfp pilus assembly pilus retraction ATPase PilT